MIFDIGANIGNWSLTNISTTNKIIAVEASLFTYSRLLDNTAAYSNIECIHYAVSDSLNDTIEFYDCFPADGCLSTTNKDWLCSTESRFYGQPINNISHIKTITLDSLINIYGVPELIKIDVEGAEENVINSLSQKINLICFEWAAEWRNSLKRAIDKLTQLGFTKFYVQYGDAYDFRPNDLSLTAEMCKNILDNSINKHDNGMIWAT